MDLSHELTLRLKLAGFSPLIASNISLEEGLREIATLATQSLNTQDCSILLLVESENKEPKFQLFTQFDSLPELADSALANLNSTVAGYVASSGKALSISDLSQSHFASLAESFDQNPPKSLISAPIYLGDQVIGVINAISYEGRVSFNPEDLDLLNLSALSVSKSVHISQLQTILRSRFLEIAVLRDWEDQNKDLLHPPTIAPSTIAPDSNKLAKIVAKSFFKELTQAGFDANQIIAIATEVLSLLQNSLNKHKKRLARDEGDWED